MDIDILDALDELSYSGPLTKDDKLQTALDLGAKSVDFTILASWLSTELQTLCQLEAVINPITDSDESSSFLLEVSSFLKELHCPFSCLIEGNISQRLGTKENRILFLNFLCSELRAARVLYLRNKNQKSSLDIEIDASDSASALNIIIESVKAEVYFSESAAELFEKIQAKVTELNPKLIKEPILQEPLSSEHWSTLEALQKEMHSEYKIRREMLLTRLDVTVMSFKWGEHSKSKDELIAETFHPLRTKMKTEPAVDISDVLAAREDELQEKLLPVGIVWRYLRFSDVTVIEKTSSAALVKNTKSTVNRVIIGPVPDRGGRPKEHRPPVEMPGFRKRTDGGGRGNFRGGQGQHFQGRGKGGGGGKHWKKSARSFDAAGSY